MTTTEAIQFIHPAIPKAQAIWADIGAGNGTFTKALDQLLLPQSTIYTIDTNTKELESLQLEHTLLNVLQQDFNEPLFTQIQF